MAPTIEQAIEAPPAQPPVYSLLSACATVDDGVRWQRGVIWSPEQSGEGGAQAVDCVGDTALMEQGENPVRNVADPFAVYAEDHCSTFGFEARDYEGRARRQLAATQSFRAAREFQLGTIRTSAGLNNVALVDGTELGPGSQVIEDAIGILEQALAEEFTGARCMLHVTVQALDEMMRKNLIYQAGQKWLTAVGNIVVCDAGYGPETSPPNPETAVFAYGTSMVQVRLGPVTIVPGTYAEALAQATLRSTNDIEMWAERLVLFQFDHTETEPADKIFKIELEMPPWHLGS